MGGSQVMLIGEIVNLRRISPFGRISVLLDALPHYLPFGCIHPPLRKIISGFKFSRSLVAASCNEIQISFVQDRKVLRLSLCVYSELRSGPSFWTSAEAEAQK